MSPARSTCSPKRTASCPKGRGYEVVVVGTEAGPFRASNGMRIVPDRTLESGGRSVRHGVRRRRPAVARRRAERGAIGLAAARGRAGRVLRFDLHRGVRARPCRAARRQARHHALAECRGAGEPLPAGEHRARPHLPARRRAGDLGRRHRGHRSRARPGRRGSRRRESPWRSPSASSWWRSARAASRNSARC